MQLDAISLVLDKPGRAVGRLPSGGASGGVDGEVCSIDGGMTGITVGCESMRGLVAGATLFEDVPTTRLRRQCT